MAWLACDNSGEEFIYEHKPSRRFYLEWNDLIDGSHHKEKADYWEPDYDCNTIKLPKGTIKKLIGRELTWDYEPVEI